MYTRSTLIISGAAQPETKEASFLVAGPGWNGEVPKGVKKVFHSETELALAMYRTPLFDPADLDNVKKVQAGYNGADIVRIPGPSRLLVPPRQFISSNR